MPMTGSIFDALGVPFQYCLEGLTHVFSAVGPLNAIGAFGLAVVATTIIIRGALFPIFGWQLRTSRRIQAEQRLIAPQLAALRKKYKGEPAKLSEEMKKLYAEHQVSPFSSLSGCLPALVQMPVLIGLYRGITAATQHLTTTGHGFLWIHDVSESAAAQCCAVAAKAGAPASTNWAHLLSAPEVLILPVLAALFTFAQSRMMMPPPRPDMTDQERTMANVTKQMSIIFPAIIFVMGLNFPQGLALYWVTGTLFMVMQQYHLVGWGSLKVPAWLPGAHRTTVLSYPKHSPVPKGTAAKAPAAKGAAPQAAIVPTRNGSGGRRAATNGSKPSSGGSEPATPTTPAASRPPRRRNNRRRR
jgi:YidC/Oxa1 family membrane protein insertase